MISPGRGENYGEFFDQLRSYHSCVVTRLDPIVWHIERDDEGHNRWTVVACEDLEHPIFDDVKASICRRLHIGSATDEGEDFGF